MNEKKLNRIIDIIREEMMSTQSTTNKPGFSGSANAKGPVAGFDPIMGKMVRRNKKKYIKLPAGSRNRWKKNVNGR